MLVDERPVRFELICDFDNWRLSAKILLVRVRDLPSKSSQQASIRGTGKSPSIIFVFSDNRLVILFCLYLVSVDDEYSFEISHLSNNFLRPFIVKIEMKIITASSVGVLQPAISREKQPCSAMCGYTQPLNGLPAHQVNWSAEGSTVPRTS